MGSIVGVDVGATGVRAVEVTSTGGDVTVKRAGTIPLPAGTMDRGGVSDTVQVEAAVKALWRKKHLGRKVALVLGGHRDIVARPATVPYLPNPQHMRGVVLADAKDILPLGLDRIYVGHHIVGVREEPVEGKKPRRVADIMLVGADRKLVDNLVLPFEKAGLEVVSVDYAPFALTRLVAAAGTDPNKLDVLVHLGAQTVMVVGVLNGQTSLIRMMNDFSGEAITLQMQDLYNLPLEEAEQVKLQASADLAEGRDSEEADALNTWVAAIVKETRSTISAAVGFAYAL